ncbi:MAG: PadR family transcriptional regulator [Bacteroidetes bacterium 4572_128]|nr:MAG: PadR family transcriptional regulator [Bacteroidetes bacterium 4572_128]
MKLKKAKIQMRKGILEYCILKILSSKDSYAFEIIKKLKSLKLIVVEGTLYPLLSRLKNGNFLSYRWEESNQGPPRKYYKLTSEGEIFLKELDNSWEELAEAVNKIRAIKKENKIVLKK